MSRLKFIHTADWHLGKLVHGVYMTEDQRYVLNQFVQLVEKEKPDAVVIAGDLYDRSIPPTEAIDLLNDILFQINVELEIPVLAITGNHDSSERLSFGSSWFRKNHLYLTSKLEDYKPVHINGVNFYLVPYAEPCVVREFLGDETISTHQDAMKAIIGKIEETLNPNEPNVFIGHAFVVGGKTCDSERTLSVGGSGAVSEDLFAPFSYTALGHLHSPDAIKHDKIFYSGSLLKYSFSEASQRKSVSIVEMKGDGSFHVRHHPLKPKRDVRIIEGYLEQLLDPSFYEKQQVDDYLKVVLLDEGALMDPMNKLRQVYPNVLHLERKQLEKDMEEKQSFSAASKVKKSELDLFEQFYTEMTSSSFTEEKREIMKKVIEEVLRGEVIK